jgi:hypothetical protein
MPQLAWRDGRFTPESALDGPPRRQMGQGKDEQQSRPPGRAEGDAPLSVAATEHDDFGAAYPDPIALKLGDLYPGLEDDRGDRVERCWQPRNPGVHILAFLVHLPSLDPRSVKTCRWVIAPESLHHQEPVIASDS